MPSDAHDAPTAGRGRHTELESQRSRGSSQSASPRAGLQALPSDARRWHVSVAGSQTRDSAHEIDMHEAPTVATTGRQSNVLSPGKLMQTVPVSHERVRSLQSPPAGIG